MNKADRERTRAELHFPDPIFASSVIMVNSRLIMRPFQLISDFEPKGDQVRAIANLDAGLSAEPPPVLME